MFAAILIDDETKKNMNHKLLIMGSRVLVPPGSPINIWNDEMNCADEIDRGKH
jgi:hypothetical protein